MRWITRSKYRLNLKPTPRRCRWCSMAIRVALALAFLVAFVALLSITVQVASAIAMTHRIEAQEHDALVAQNHMLLHERWSLTSTDIAEGTQNLKVSRSIKRNE